jgi:hypothetical protein
MPRIHWVARGAKQAKAACVFICSRVKKGEDQGEEKM